MYVWTLSCVKSKLYVMHYALDAAARGLAEGLRGRSAMHLEQKVTISNCDKQMPLCLHERPSR